MMRNLPFLTSLYVTLLFPAAGFGQTWLKVVDQPEITIVDRKTYVATPVNNGTWVVRNFKGSYKCWESLNEDSSLNAPWTSGFDDLFDLTSNNWFWTVGDQNNIAKWTIDWVTSQIAGGQVGIEKWRHVSTNKHQERRVSSHHPTGLSGGSPD